MERAKEIVKKIILIHDANKLIGKPDNIEELARLIIDYQGEEKKDWKFNQPDDRADSPHHHNNRLD